MSIEQAVCAFGLVPISLETNRSSGPINRLLLILRNPYPSCASSRGCLVNGPREHLDEGQAVSDSNELEARRIYAEALEESDERKAFQLFQQAADKGHIHAIFVVGTLQQMGKGTEQSMTAAAKSYRAAAEAGHAKACFNLGMLQQTGNGVKKDIQSAIASYKAAEKAGIPGAAYNLAALYYVGQHGEPEPGRALQWYARAAWLGDPRGRDGVRMCLENMRIDQIFQQSS